MKKQFFILLISVATITGSCSLSKVNKTYRNSINGTWTLNDISFKNVGGSFKAKLFNDAEAICFEGSEWFFRENNSTGHYTLKSASICDTGNRYIRWSVVEGDPNQLQFKFTDEKNKDLSGAGYRLTISSLSEQEMTLQNYAMVDGDRVTIVYNFTKNN